MDNRDGHTQEQHIRLPYVGVKYKIIERVCARASERMEQKIKRNGQTYIQSRRQADKSDKNLYKSIQNVDVDRPEGVVKM